MQLGHLWKQKLRSLEVHSTAVGTTSWYEGIGSCELSAPQLLMTHIMDLSALGALKNTAEITPVGKLSPMPGSSSCATQHGGLQDCQPRPQIASESESVLERDS